MAKNKPTTPSHSVEVLAELMDRNDGMCGEETFDWFDLDKRAAFIKRMDSWVLNGGYFQVKPT